MSSGSSAGHQDPVAAFETAKLGVWTFLATEVLLFGALFTAYTVFRLKFPELFHAEHEKLNRVLGAVNTVVLITSSLTVALGIDAVKRGKVRALQGYFAATILLAGVFLAVKYVEYSEKFHHGLFPRTNIFFSLYYVMTGIHGIHVIAGMAVMAYILAASRRGRFSEAYYTPVEMAGLYWHFVDLVWIYLFPLLYLAG